MHAYTELVPGVSQEGSNSLAAAEKLTSVITHRGVTCGVEKGSVYGSAIAMPQIARSAHWSKTMTTLAARCLLILAFNFSIQALLLYMIRREQEVWNRFAGQMNLCDFGAGTLGYGGAGNVGPGGTKITPARTYSWNQWTVRVFIRDSLKLVFPDKGHEIDSKVDPGEYAMEDYVCRLCCCFVFMVKLMKSLCDACDIALLMHVVPSRADSWIRYQRPTWADKSFVKAVNGWSEIDLVAIQIAGIPRCWKVFNILFIAVPKFVLWTVTATAGVTFLMETASMDDLIVNCTALTFILTIDEMLEECFTISSVRYMIDRLEPFSLIKEDGHEKPASDEEAEGPDKLSARSTSNLNLLVPRKMLIALVLTAGFVFDYYCRKCKIDDDGSWVSKSMYTPKSSYFSMMNFLFPAWWPVETEDHPYWTMPSE